MSTVGEAGRVRLAVDGGVARIVFDRPAAHNAMTWAMYAELADHCEAIERLAAEGSVKVATLRGAGGRAFVAGTDIAQFAAFASGEDGIGYERRIDAGIERLERLPLPTLAVLDGWVVGGGLAIAAACDLRIATPAARFGVPIARTLGNMLSAANTRRLLAGFGLAGARRMLLLAEMLDADEARAAGFLTRVVAADALDAAVDAACAALAGHAPLTMRAAKETMRRLGAAAGDADVDDLIRLVYGSADFAEGVCAFVAGRPPRWQGR